MAISKNFIVKNGIEIGTDLIVGDPTNRNVGVGTTRPLHKLHVNGGIGATTLSVLGVSTFKSGPVLIGVENSSGVSNQLLQVGSSTTTADAYISGSIGIGTANSSAKLNVVPTSSSIAGLFSGTTSDSMIHITQLGTGNALVVEDSTSPDSSAFVINASGYVGIGTAASTYPLAVYTSALTGQTGIYNHGDVVVTGSVTADTLSVSNVVGSNLNQSGIATVNSLSIGSTQVVSSGRQLQNIVSLDATTTATIETAISNGPNIFNDLQVTGITTLNQVTATSLNVSGLTTAVTLTGTNLNYSGVGTIATLNSTASNITTGNITNTQSTNLNVSGVGTLGNVKISSGIVTASSGIVTYYGDGQYLTNVTRGIGIQTAGSGGPIGYGATILDFRGPGISTITVGSGIGTINITGGVSIAVTSIAPATASLGNLWFNIHYARTFIYYDEVALGIGSDKYWIDAAPFNVGVITSLTNVSFLPSFATAPSFYFVGDAQTGLFSPSLGQQTFVSSGSSVLNINSSGIRVTGVTTTSSAVVGSAVTINSSGIRVTGIVTANNVVVGGSTTALVVNGDTRITGILTVGSGSITINGSSNAITGVSTANITNVYASSINNGQLGGSRNMIINGSMVVNQRGWTGAAGTTLNGSYTTDRFRIEYAHDGVVSAGQTTLTSTTGGNAYIDGFQNAHILRVTTGDASLAAGQFQMIRQYIEGFNVQGIKKGTVNALPVTLSFWCRSTTTGTYIAELYDNDNTREVSQAYTINASNTWEKKTLTFPADTTGVFDNDNNGSLIVGWYLAAGSQYSSGTLQTTWAGITTANRAVGQVNALGTVGDFWLTGVQLEIGNQATEFERRIYGQELALCQRYFGLYSSATSSGQNASNYYANAPFRVSMRATPTLTVTSDISGTLDAFTNTTTNFTIPIHTTTSGTAASLFTASAEL